MEISVFTQRRPADEFNDLPEPRERRGSVFWDFMRPVLSLPAERFEPVHNEGVSREIAKIREYEARREQANQPPQAPSIVSEIASEVADHIATAVKKVPALKRATEFLARVLDSGPVGEKEVARLAALENLSEKTLKRARAKLKVKATKKGRGGWFLSMTRAEGEGKEGRDS